MPAIAAVGALDVIVIGLALALIAMAIFPLFRPILGQGLSQVPVIGGWLSGNVDLVLFRAYTSALVTINAGIGPLIDVVRAVRYANTYLWSYTIGTIENIYNTMVRVRTQYIPAAILVAETYANARADQVAGYALQLHQVDVAYALQLAQQLAQQLAARSAQLAAYASDLYRQSVGYTSLVGQQLAARDALLQQQAIAYTQQGLTAQQAYTQLVAQQLEHALEAGDLAAEQYAGQLARQAEQYAGQVGRAAIDHADAAAGAVAVAAAASTAAVASRVTDLEDSPCQRFCGPLGDLGGLLQAITELGLPALLLAMAASLAEDPQGAAQALDDVVGGPVRSLASELGSGAGEAAGALGSFERFGGPARAA